MMVLEPTLAIILCLLDGINAAFRVSCEPFANAKMDPIVSPNTLSGHFHTIAGSLGFADSIDANWMRNNGTTCSHAADFSNYWTPGIYRSYVNKPPVLLRPVFQPYYLYKASDVPYMDPATIAKPLPMVLGNASGAMDPEQYHIDFEIRVGPLGETVQNKNYGWPAEATDVRELVVQYFFPSCWNGKPYEEDQSHTAYPDVLTNRCPATHTFQYPALQLEQRYILDAPASWTNGRVPFFFTSGADNTAHADAVLMWDPDTMATLFARCVNPDANFCDNVGARQDSGDRYTLSTTYKVPPQYALDPKDRVVVPTPAPTYKATPRPSFMPTFEPTKIPPTPKPSTARPTKAPTAYPSPKPTYKTATPTLKPTKPPTRHPTLKPTKAPTAKPSPKPTYKPTPKPTKAPSVKPSPKPTDEKIKPTQKPTKAPSVKPSPKPTDEKIKPTQRPTNKTTEPTQKPTKAPYAKLSPQVNDATTTPSLTPAQQSTESLGATI